MAIGIKRGLSFLVTLFAAFMMALPILCMGLGVDSGYEASSSEPMIDVASDGYVPWSFAVITDLHVGREFGDYDGPGYNDSGTPISGAAASYAQDAVNEINKIAVSQGIAFVAVLGDLTETAEASQLRAAKQILDNLTVPWIPIMGNHDSWPHTDTEVAPACCPPPESYFDSIMAPQYSKLATELSGWGEESPNVTWDPEVSRDTYFQNFFFDYGGFHFVCLDFNSRLGYAAGELHGFPGGTWSWFREHMEEFVQLDPERSRDVIVLAHHPMRDDGDSSDRLNFSASELAQFSSFANDSYYTYVDASGNAQSRPYASRIWGQFAGHRHPWALRVDYPAWLDGGPVITYPRNFGEVRIGLVKVFSNTQAGVDFSDPTVTTQAPTNMSLVSATLNGYLANMGTSSSVEVRFEWGTTTDYGFETPPQPMLGPGSFSSALSGLIEGTTYHFRAKAAGDGTSLGSDMAFTVSAMPPVVTTNDVTGLTATSATLNGVLASLGTAASVDVSFEWGLSTDYGNVTTQQVHTATGTFSANLSGLTVNTVYHCRSRADGDGTTYGSDITFTTDLMSAPAVTSSPATSIATTSATLNGALASLGTAASVVVSFEWGTSPGSYTQTTGSRTLTAAGAFSEGLTGLTPGTTYYYRARADGDGSDEGDEMRFTTAVIRPSVATVAASNLDTTSATLNGNLSALGTAASVFVSFEWGTTPGFYTQATDTQMRDATGAFYDELSGLTPGTTYYCRAKADGDGTPVHGTERSFTTSILPAAVITAEATNTTTTSATLNAELSALGTAVSVEVSFEWGTAPGSYTETTGSWTLTAAGAFSHELTGLAPGTTYCYRARADGHGSPAYGLEESLATRTTPPAVGTKAAGNLAATSATLNGELIALGTATSVVVSFEWGTSSGSYTQTTGSRTLTAAGAFYDTMN